ncbi:MAG: hypothetical protein A3D35_01815 [Candidatus Staskawiczbacteria bacterium RIFCSPHIGHO2_02_FULL_34_9]|uniref:Uncharacterized protein n=1 Tax=Candidatus Staskawiczbacteria bacterium RIFCSPHIGHO2_02_FULL_34_9 TaxID=1802206 RepID=A0A1G2HWR0_9BACT|nr:MAG: hypothetical protein A3D35_01815 [Candidatus Staskawiczbacteria bacterium RIFCSPHIGHO2_02_FULL_34_9]
MNKKLIASSAITLLSIPAVMLAFNPGNIPNASPTLDINTLVDVLFSILWPVAVAFFIVMFIMAAFKFATAQGDPTAIASARSFLIWGIVGVIVALLAFSIPFIVRNTLGSGI